MIIWRIKKVIKKTKTYFEANYKKYHILITWDKQFVSWYIKVTPKELNEPMAYMGWWGNEKYDIDDAIYEAMRGSGLI